MNLAWGFLAIVAGLTGWAIYETVRQARIKREIARRMDELKVLWPK